MAAPMRIACRQFSRISRLIFAPNGTLQTQRHFQRFYGAVGRRATCGATSRPSWYQSRPLSTEAATEEETDYHSIIKDTERSKGPSLKHEFQAETRQLLDIVAKSLYSEREVFIREVISNASDALEKLRYTQLSDPSLIDRPLEIHIATDDQKKTFTIQDTGVGLTKEEMIDQLGTIAKSGSKLFLDEMKRGESGPADVNSRIIGQFGVGFYSTFMVGDKVDVYSRSHKDEQAHKWSSDGTGSYEIAEAEGVEPGTKIVVHLRGDCYDYSSEDIVKSVITRYSNFVGVPIYLNGKRVNVIEITVNGSIEANTRRCKLLIRAEPLWMKDGKDITLSEHEEFYKFVSGTYDAPRYVVHYKTDAPINIRALLYVPEQKPTIFDMSREIDHGTALYSRKVMVMAKSVILPKWLRFMRGVVDSEDIPLNLSRELLQNSALIRKLTDVLTARLLKFFNEQAKKDPEKYVRFHEDYGLFFREGIVTTPDQARREEIAKLLRFESSALPAGELTGLEEYADRMKAGSRQIFYLSAPSRELAQSSPYFEALSKKDVEVLFCYEPYDELVLMNLGQYDNKYLKSVESEVQAESSDGQTVEAGQEGSLSQAEAEGLMTWLRGTLGERIHKAKINNKLVTHPCVITVQEMGSVRHFLRTTLADKSEEEKLRLMQPTLEINPSHTIIKKLNEIRTNDAELAELVAAQIYDNAMIAAGLMEDPRRMLTRLNHILTKTLEKI